ncbi:hypothetical protein ABFS83_14G176100 [Erythranthe nasuta]
MNLLSKIVIIISLIYLTTCDAAPEVHVTVASVIPADPITVHCYSKDDDLGTHQLAYLQPLSWHFHYSILGDTKFSCKIDTQYGSGEYTVWTDDIMVNRCGLNCIWQVKSTGPCLQQSQGDLWCLPWQ